MIVRQHQDNGLGYAFIARGDPNPPLRFAVLAGEIIHHLRSTLDHLIHVLVMKNAKTPTRRHQFPICATSKAFQDARTRGLIEGVGATAERVRRSGRRYEKARFCHSRICSRGASTDPKRSASVRKSADGVFFSV
jgi:hypothetical protein